MSCRSMHDLSLTILVCCMYILSLLFTVISLESDTTIPLIRNPGADMSLTKDRIRKWMIPQIHHYKNGTKSTTTSPSSSCLLTSLKAPSSTFSSWIYTADCSKKGTISDADGIEGKCDNSDLVHVIRPNFISVRACKCCSFDDTC